MDIRIYRQKRRSLMMRPIPGAVEVFIPHQLSEDDPLVQQFIDQHLAKIDIPAIPEIQTSATMILAMVDEYAAKMGVNPTRVQLRDMRRKWGSCSSRGTVTLNRRLEWLPPDLVEYIVCHELAHLIELNHSPRFWSLVGQYMPDYAEREQTLRRLERDLW